jgi:hypothetical protein
LVCHMAGTMKFSEVPPYPYTCRSLHRVRTGKMRDKVAVRGISANGRLITEPLDGKGGY